MHIVNDNLWFQMHGFTCGVVNLLLDQSSDMERKRILEKSEALSEDVHIRFTAFKDGDRGLFKLLCYSMHVKIPFTSLSF